MTFFVLPEEEDCNDDDGEEDAAFFLIVFLALTSLDEVAGLALEALLSMESISFELDGDMGARYVSKTVLRV